MYNIMEKKIKLWLETLDNNKKPDEFDAKQLVKLYSIKVPRGIRLKPKEALCLDDIKPPYVLKVCSSDILHKTELQGVVLNNDKESVQDNFTMIQNRFPGENILLKIKRVLWDPNLLSGS